MQHSGHLLARQNKNDGNNTNLGLVIVDPIEANRLVRLPEVIRLSGMSRSTIYKHMEEGTFPKPKRVGVKMIAWKMSDLINWIDGLDSQ